MDFDPATFLAALGGTNLPIPMTQSAEEVRKQAASESETIFRAYETLHEIVRRHEPTIQKRWMKKNGQQRLKILLDAWPAMPSAHRPDFDAFFRESASGRGMKKKHKEYYMWPHINREDLSDARPLLLLLNARGRNPPSAFAAADIDAMHLGLTSKAIIPIFLNEHVLMLNGFTENTHEYGKLKQFMPGEGLLVLEAQQKVLAFLEKCCRLILHDIPEETIVSDSFPVQPEPQLKRESEVAGFDSLAVMAADALYRLPAKLNLDRIYSLLRAKASAAEDHIWSLREDPGYFASTLHDAKEHRQEMLRDWNGSAHPVLSPGREQTLWCRILSNASAAGVISPSTDLPEDYAAALLRFRHYLNQAVAGPIGKLKNAASASPPLRRFFVRQPMADPSSTIIHKVEQKLIWLLQTIWENGNQLFLASLPLVMDELQRLILSEPHAKGLVSDYMADLIGELSILAQCFKELELYNPWARTWENDAADRAEDLKKEFAQNTKPWSGLMAGISAALSERSRSTKAVTLGQPTGGKFTYPIEKRRTKENVEALRKAEANLDAFWATVDGIVASKAGDLDKTAVWKLLTQPRILQRTEEWVEPAPEPEKGAVPLAVDIHTSYHPISMTYSGLSGRSLAAEPKTKTKTRGIAQPDTAAPEPTPATAADTQPTFSVDARALKVFRTLFFNPAATSTPGEIPWTDFLHALASVGFETMKLYGSAWQFQPKNLDVERNILFHEPHPRGKLPFTVARRYGRRLSRAYGWFGEMFVLGDKQNS
ncbi:hypothetical protein BJY00DRAFT_323347 [Aspergillus carlsbadensis]|nr:hypothetical protein BJY00DRAFT_323347 [Aspergillus carlsbadensis]